MASKTLLFLLFAVSSQAFYEYYIPDVFHKGDDRKVFSENSPSWLSAVGRIGEHCTGNLVASDEEENSRVVTSGYHCVTRYFSSEKKDIKIVFTTKENKRIERKAQIFGPGSLDYDAVILILDKPISHKIIQGLIVDEFVPEEHKKLKVAGYSVDQKLGQKGKQLTYDEDCSLESVVRNDNYKNAVLLSDCSTYGGASGGAVVYTDDDPDWGTTHYIVGHSIMSNKKGKIYFFGYFDEYQTSYTYFLENVFEAMSEFNTFDD